MKENKYICPKCGCKIATTKWEDIDLDDTDYEIVLKLSANPSMNQVKFLSNITGQNSLLQKSSLKKEEYC